MDRTPFRRYAHITQNYYLARTRKNLLYYEKA